MWAVIISILALFVSAISVYLNYKTNNRQNKLQENNNLIQKQQTEIQGRLYKIEQTKEDDRIVKSQIADIVIIPTKEQCGSARRGSMPIYNYYIVFENKGQALAQNIEIFLDDNPTKDNYIIQRDGQPEIREIESGELKRYFLGQTIQPLPKKAIVIWEDGTGRHEKKEQLNFS